MLKAQATTMKEWADAFFQWFEKTNETNKMSSGDFHTLMAKVESVGKSLQKGAKNNTPNSNKRGSERALTLSKTLVKISTSIVFTSII